jgi:hypothetical protein
VSVRTRPARLAAGLGAVLALGVVAAGPAAAEDFGTAPVTGAGLSAAGSGAAVATVTVGRHATFDRVVFTAEAGLPRWELRYVASVVQDGSGAPVPLDGAADLLLVFRGTDWTDHPSQPRNLEPRHPALRQVTSAGEFEGDLSYGIGQATKAGFRAFTLTGPNRLVVDVAHPAGSPASPSVSPSVSPSASSSASSSGSSSAPGPDPVATGVTEPVGSATTPPAAADPVGTVTDTDTGSGRSGPGLLIGGGLLLLGLLTAAGVLVQTRRSP